MPISVYVDASVGQSSCGVGIRICVDSAPFPPIDLATPAAKMGSPNEAEVFAIKQAADTFLTLVRLIDFNKRLKDEYITLYTDSTAAFKAVLECEAVKDKRLRVLAKNARTAWDDIRRNTLDDARGLIAGWEIKKIDRTKNPAHALAAAAMAQTEDLFKWKPKKIASGPSRSKSSKSAVTKPSSKDGS